jgi:ribosomal protein S18 acetylase RimI-like enzyme
MVREIAAHQNQAEAVTTDAGRWADILGRADVIVLIAYLDGAPVGYVSAIRRIHFWTGTDILALDDLYVRENARDRGVGRILMNELADSFAVPERLTITWGVQPGNTAAIRFYERLGATMRPKVVAGWSPASSRTGTL